MSILIVRFRGKSVKYVKKLELSTFGGLKYPPNLYFYSPHTEPISLLNKWNKCGVDVLSHLHNTQMLRKLYEELHPQ